MINWGDFYMTQKYFGVMTVNITGVELVIVNLKTHKSLEKVDKEINLGDDVYRNRPVQFTSVNKIVEALTGFIQILRDYDIENYQLWGSQGLSQAINADFIADQFYLHTGLEINWLSISDEAYYRNQNIALEFAKKQSSATGIVYLIGITSGNTSITRFDNGNFITSTNFSLGPVKIAEDLDSLRRSAPNSIGVLSDYIDSKLKDFDRDGQITLLPDNQETQVMLLGTSSLKKIVAEYTKNSNDGSLDIDTFRDLLDTLVDASDQYLMEQLMINESVIPLVLPELLLIDRIVQLTNAKTLRFSDSSVIDGVVNNEEVALGFSKHDFSNQTIKMSMNLANHYNVEPIHRDIVTKFALHLFNQLKPLHRLGKREAVLLEVASILHDVGNYISVHSHYIHSEYIIRHSDIIGLSQEEKEIVAAIAKYHSVTTPSADLSHFNQISTENRRLISKLAAILRLADALDDDRQQKIKKISVSIKNHHVIISAYSNDSLAYENWIFNSKSQFFQETYGLKPILKQKGVKP